MITLEQKQTIRFIADILRNHNIPFQLTGGIAAIIYGADRSTPDIDIDINRKDIPTVRRLFKEHIIEDLHHLIDDGFDLWVLTMVIDGMSVDISQAEESYCIKASGAKVRMDARIAHAKLCAIDGYRVPVQDKEELIAYKKITGRDIDLVDVEQVSSS